MFTVSWKIEFEVIFDHSNLVIGTKRYANNRNAGISIYIQFRLHLHEKLLAKNSGRDPPAEQVIKGTPLPVTLAPPPAGLKNVGADGAAVVPVFGGRIRGDDKDGEPSIVDVWKMEKSGMPPGEAEALVSAAKGTGSGVLGGGGEGYLDALRPLIMRSVSLSQLMKQKKKMKLKQKMIKIEKKIIYVMLLTAQIMSLVLII